MMSLATDIPTFLTPFIGRAEDVDEVCSLLAQADCRLLSLIGPGGIGKTRLASQVLLNCREAGQSVAFVDLQPVRSADSLASSIADALDLPRCEQENTKEYLLHAIARRKMLLVLDNFEHLLDGVALLSEILAVAPQIQLLVTSRTVLQLQEEWLYPLGGLRFPVTSNLAAQQWANWESAKSYDAVQLFVACARRARSSFEPGTEVEGIVRVCELVDGLPLAIELAAAWAKTMAASDIAVELQSDLTFLATPLRNMPSKHRSMQAVFQRSWQMLAPGERAVFQRLSIFRGGFDRVAASHVAGASLSTLSALVDKSLLRWHPSGRYEIHELLRQFGEAELALSPQTIAQVRRQHSSYYAGFLYDRVDKLTTQQRQALLQIEDELENIRLAWQWSTEDANLADISRAALPFFAYCQGQSRFREGAYLLAAAFDALANTPASAELDRTRADLLTGRGWLELRLGRLDVAEALLQRACALYEASDLAPAPFMGADPLAARAVLAVSRGDYAGAVMWGETAWQAASKRNDQANLALAGYGLTSAAIAQGRYGAAFQYAGETLNLTKVVGNRWFTAYIYNQLGEISQSLGQLDTAEDHYRESYAIREDFDDPEGMAVALNHLGEIMLLKGDYAQAETFYDQSAALYKGLGDQGGWIQALHGLGMAASGQGQWQQARRHLQQALEAAIQAEITPILLWVLAGVGTFLAETGARQWGTMVWESVYNHPATDQMTREKVRQLLDSGEEPGISVPAVALPQSNGEPNLAWLTNPLLVELSAPHRGAQNTVAVDSTTTVPNAYPPVPQEEQELIEPLSGREQEVLALVAQGLSNKQIAENLYVTLSTVKAHCNNIYRKLDVNNRVQAIARAQDLGLL